MRSVVVGLLYFSFLVTSAKAAAFNANAMRFQEVSNSSFPSTPNTTHLNTISDTSRQNRLHRKRVRWLPTLASSRSMPRYISPPPSRIKRSPTPAGVIDARPTPEPTGDPSPSTTVHIQDTNDFSLILPKEPGELIGDAEADGVSYCSPGASSSTCVNRFPDGFITAAAFEASSDGAYVQITGCIEPSAFHLDPTDTGGQFDVRYPNGAQCSFGGYAASFIELVEPGTNRFCIRCCSSENDQVNCNSHQDRMGCTTAIPGVYDFPELGVSCS